MIRVFIVDANYSERFIEKLVPVEKEELVKVENENGEIVEQTQKFIEQESQILPNPDYKANWICVNTDNDADAETWLAQEARELTAEEIETTFGDKAAWVSPTTVKLDEDGEIVSFTPPQPTEEELLEKAKSERSEAVSQIVVEVDGMKFDGDEESQTRMGRTVAAAVALGVDIETYTQTWVLADNTVATPTIKQLAQALKLAGEAQTNLWTIPYE